METLKKLPAPLLGWLLSLLLLLALALPGGLLSRLEPALADVFRVKSLMPAEDLVLVDIDESSLAVLGPWPWHREILAELGARITEHGARQQLWDLILAEPRNGDSALNKLLAAGQIRLGVVPVIDPNVDAPPQAGAFGRALSGPLCAADSPFPRATGGLGVAASLDGEHLRTGHLTPVFDRDGRLRKIPAVICHGELPLPALALSALHGVDTEWRWIRDGFPGRPQFWLENGSVRLPLDGEGNFQLAFATPLESYLTVPAHQLLGGQLPEGMLTGKTVILGASAIGLGARVATPLSAVTPGLVVHGELYSRLQQGNLPLPMHNIHALTLILLALLSLPLVWRPAQARVGLALSFVLTFGLGVWLLNLGYLVALLAILLWHGLFALALLLCRFWAERTARRSYQRHLASVIPPALLEHLGPEAPQDIVAARRQQFGVVHGRLRNLSQFAHREAPETVLALLHALNRAAQKLAERHGAQLYPAPEAQFLIVWPNVEPQRDSLRMLEAARQWHAEASRILAEVLASPPMAMEVAVHIDEALDGFIGSRDRRRPVLYGRLLQVSDALLALSAELASPIVLTKTLQLPPAALESLRELGGFRLPDLRDTYHLQACKQACDAPGEAD